MDKKKVNIVLTGGGTAGHVMPNIALIEAFAGSATSIAYIGSKTGIEKTLIEAQNIPYYPIETGKFRRYWTWQHVTEPFRVLKGLWQAYTLLGLLRPEIVFSKGGFVSFPVVVMAWLRGIPVVAHESDMTPGLANRMALPFVKRFCINFPQTQAYFKDASAVYVTGTPIRKALLEGDKQMGYKLTGFSSDKPILMVMGGSMGAKKINQVLRQTLPKLLSEFQVIHLCGKGHLDPELESKPGYRQFEFAEEELGHLFAMTDLVVSRSGANAVYELLTLKKPHILIPLSKQASRGDQIDNASYFAEQGISEVIIEEELTPESLVAAIHEVDANKEELSQKIEGLGFASATDKVKTVLLSLMN